MSKYVHLYGTDSEFKEDYMGVSYKEPWLSRTLENKETNYKSMKPPIICTGTKAEQQR